MGNATCKQAPRKQKIHPKMPSTKYANGAPQWRQRKNAIGKKAFESELLMDADVISKPSGTISPTSTFARFEMPDEIKPLTLPGAWTVVGKKGRPLKNSLMYNEPKKKMRKRNRAPKEAEDADSYMAKLEEAPSSSKCVQLLQESTSKHNKAAARGKSSKDWARYRQAKEAKMKVLVAALLDDCTDSDDESAQTKSTQTKERAPKTMRNSHAAKTRRKARFESAAARCYSLEDMSFESAPFEASESVKVAAPVQKSPHHGRKEEVASMRPSQQDHRKARAEEPRDAAGKTQKSCIIS